MCVLPETAVGLIGQSREEVNINVIAAVVSEANGEDFDTITGEVGEDVGGILSCGADAIGEEDNGFRSLVVAVGEQSVSFF